MEEQPKGEVRLELYRSAHFVVDKRSGDVVLCMRRLPTPLLADEVLVETDRISRAIAGVDRARHGLLLDMRAPVINHDPAFEKAAQHFRQEIFQGFASVMVLTATATGALQVKRQAREEGFDSSVAEDAAALARLREQVAAARARPRGAQ